MSAKRADVTRPPLEGRQHGIRTATSDGCEERRNEESAHAMRAPARLVDACASLSSGSGTDGPLAFNGLAVGTRRGAFQSHRQFH